jgi:hypothetical protein
VARLRALQRVHELAPVGQAGEDVVVSEVVQLGLEGERLTALHARGDFALHGLGVVGMDDARVRARRAADEVRRRIAGDLLDPLADVLHLPVVAERAATVRARPLRQGMMPARL